MAIGLAANQVGPPADCAPAMARFCTFGIGLPHSEQSSPTLPRKSYPQFLQHDLGRSQWRNTKGLIFEYQLTNAKAANVMIGSHRGIERPRAGQINSLPVLGSLAKYWPGYLKGRSGLLTNSSIGFRRSRSELVAGSIRHPIVHILERP
jgi:hypothetical protein